MTPGGTNLFEVISEAFDGAREFGEDLEVTSMDLSPTATNTVVSLSEGTVSTWDFDAEPGQEAGMAPLADADADPPQVSRMGGSVATRNILDGKARTKWCFREGSADPADNGWRFLSEIDTNEYLADSSNSVVVGWDTLLHLEPAIMPIIDMPVGTEITIMRDGEGKFSLIDSRTGQPLEFGPDYSLRPEISLKVRIFE